MVNAGSTSRLFASILGSMFTLLLGFWVFTELNGLLSLIGLVMIAASTHAVVLAYRLIDHQGPLITVTGEGLELAAVLSPVGHLPWSEVQQLRHVTMRAVNDPLGWFDYVMIRTSRKDAFQGMARLLPTARLGIYFVPTRMLEGGSAAGAALASDADRVRRDSSQGQAIARAHRQLGSVPVSQTAQQAPASALHSRSASSPATPAPMLTPRETQRPSALPAVPLVAARQDLGKAPAKPKSFASKSGAPASNSKGVLLNGKPLEF